MQEHVATRRSRYVVLIARYSYIYLRVPCVHLILIWSGYD